MAMLNISWNNEESSVFDATDFGVLQMDEIQKKWTALNNFINISYSK